jgi:nucleotidyltransferase AbiEii toxin of type IV toxin-antitoxin system
MSFLEPRRDSALPYRTSKKISGSPGHSTFSLTGLPIGRHRFLFKGGTSLSKAYGLISRFSEDIDITVFREDLGQTASVTELETMGRNRRKAKLEAIKDACRE